MVFLDPSEIPRDDIGSNTNNQPEADGARSVPGNNCGLGLIQTGVEFRGRERHFLPAVQRKPCHMLRSLNQYHSKQHGGLLELQTLRPRLDIFSKTSDKSELTFVLALFDAYVNK
jgi:hypothetical protein